MSKKHYEATAAAFRKRLDEWAGTPQENAVQQALYDTAEDLAAMFAANPLFDRERFLTACGFSLWAGTPGAGAKCGATTEHDTVAFSCGLAPGHTGSHRAYADGEQAWEWTA